MGEWGKRKLEVVRRRRIRLGAENVEYGRQKEENTDIIRLIV